MMLRRIGTTTERLSIAELCCDDALRPRVAVDAQVARDYAASLKAGIAFRPVLVFYSGREWILVDGYHRVEARRLLGFSDVLAEVRPGTREDAIWETCTVNQAHGLRRSNADKRRSVQRALCHVRGQRLSDRQIARHCGVHHYTVGRIRAELVETGALSQIDRRIVIRGGAEYTQQISGISEANSSRAANRVATNWKSSEALVATLSEVEHSQDEDDVANRSLSAADRTRGWLHSALVDAVEKAVTHCRGLVQQHQDDGALQHDDASQTTQLREIYRQLLSLHAKLTAVLSREVEHGR